MVVGVQSERERGRWWRPHAPRVELAREGEEIEDGHEQKLERERTSSDVDQPGR
jgi:hypothetical protein